MTREEFIDNLYKAMYQNSNVFTKENNIINVIDKFILELNNDRVCKNCKWFYNNNCNNKLNKEMFDFSCVYVKVNKSFGCNRFERR